MNEHLKHPDLDDLMSTFKGLDYNQFKEDFSQHDILKLWPPGIKYDPEQFVLELIPIATFTPAYPHMGEGRGLVFSDVSFLYTSPSESFSGIAGFSAMAENEAGLTPAVGLHFEDYTPGKYVIKFYVSLSSSSEYLFRTSGPSSYAMKSLKGPGHFVISVPFDNNIGSYCRIEQQYPEEDSKHQWTFFKAVVARSFFVPFAERENRSINES